MTYEELLLQYHHLTILETDLSKVRGLKGLCYDDCIAIEKTLDFTEKGCILAEEIGHYLTSSGDILNQDKIENRKQEHKARAVAYDIQIGLSGIIDAYETGCTSPYMIADYLCVTEAFLQDAIEYYSRKYGLYTKIGSYVIYFEPSLCVMRMLNEKTAPTANRNGF